MIRIAMPQMGHDPFRIYMKHKYVSSLHAVGASVCWVTLDDPSAAVQQSLDCDGLLLPGGRDIAPALYGQEPLAACGAPHPERDAAEPMLLRAFLQEDRPILCICRGMQMLNVVSGGTLLQDISKTQQCKHSDFASRSRGCHRVDIVPDTRLADILGAEPCIVNSLHHQVVDRIGNGLRVNAYSEDGYIEGLERPASGFCIGVQWHPEHMSQHSMQQRRLFAAFVNACRDC